MCLSDLTLQTPKKQNPCRWPPKRFQGTPEICFLFCDLGPILGQKGPILRDAWGHCVKASPWMGPNSKKWDLKCSETHCFIESEVSLRMSSIVPPNRSKRGQIGPIEWDVLHIAPNPGDTHTHKHTHTHTSANPYTHPRAGAPTHPHPPHPHPHLHAHPHPYPRTHVFTKNPGTRTRTCTRARASTVPPKQRPAAQATHDSSDRSCSNLILLLSQLPVQKAGMGW